MRLRNVRSVRGFTLIELMVAVGIVAILAAVATPSYTAYVVRGQRAAAKMQMLEIASREHQYLMSFRRYADKSTLGFTLPSEVSQRYGWDVTVGNGTVPSFVITFTPTGPQASDGVLTLDNLGNKAPLAKWQK